MSWPRSLGRIGGVLAALVFASSVAFAQDPQPKPSPAPGPGQPPPAPSQPALAPGQPTPAPGPGQPAPGLPAPSHVHVGTLMGGDQQLESGEYYDEYTIQAGPGDEIIAVVTAIDFDPYLLLMPPTGEPIENDDYAGSADVSLIEIPVEEAGAYRVRVTSYEPGMTGEYSLMAATRVADGDDAGEYFEPEEFTVKGPIQPGGLVAGTLGADDPVRNDGSYYEAFSLQGQPGMNLVITLKSKDFDAYLTLVSPSGELQENDDQAEGDHDSRLEVTLDEAGEWIVVANTLTAEETGNYQLLVVRK
jgi:serine protease Do